MLKYLLEKEFKQFFRNSFMPKIVVILPTVLLLVFPLIANLEIKNINLSIVDNDKTPFSQQLIQKIQSSDFFRISNVSSNYKQALASVESNTADAIFEIPANFEKDLVNEKSARVMISSNAINGVKGGMGSYYLSGIISNFSNQLRIKWIAPESKYLVPHITIAPLFLYNPSLQYYVFIIPALMIMVLAIICGVLPAVNIVMEKENGTIEQMNVTPVSKFTFILSKLIPHWVIGFVVLTICFVIARLAYGLTPVGSLLTIYLFASLFVLAFSGFGLVISNYASTMQQAAFMMLFFILTFVFMSGLYTPVENMPEWAQMLSNFSPLKYIIKVFRLVYLKGSTPLELLNPFFALSSFAIFLNIWAVYSYRKSS